MSLPTILRLFDKNNNLVENVHINVGWFLTAKDLSRELLEQCPFIEGVEYVEAYEYRFPYSIFLRMREPLAENETFNDRKAEFEKAVLVQMATKAYTK